MRDCHVLLMSSQQHHHQHHHQHHQHHKHNHHLLHHLHHHHHLSSSSWVDRTFEAPLHSGSKAFLHVRSRIIGDSEELVVQALRVAESVARPEGAALDVEPGTTYADLRGGDQSADGQDQNATSTSAVGSTDKQLTATSSTSSVCATPTDARARNAFRVVYQLRLRDTSAVGVEAYAVDLETSRVAEPFRCFGRTRCAKSTCTRTRACARSTAPAARR
jgi:hypothetical protein